MLRDRFYPRGKATALHHAAKAGNSEMVAHLLATTNPNVVSEYGATALHYAAENGHCEVVAQLLAASPGLIGATDSEYRTALFSTASREHEAVVAQLLAVDPSLIRGVDLNHKTPLHEATSVGVVDVLLGAEPAMIDAVDIFGNTPLHWAAYFSLRLVVKRLLEVKPELASVVNNVGDTPLHLAVLMSYSGQQASFPAGICAVKPKAENSSIWMLAKANPQALRVANGNGQTPLHIAVGGGHGQDSITMLLQHGLLFDEVVSVFKDCNRNYQELLRPSVETQCECLLTLLHRDVAGTVLEYLGFDRPPQQHKRARLT